jgi:hypothetical protein
MKLLSPKLTLINTKVLNSSTVQYLNIIVNKCDSTRFNKSGKI